MDNRRIIKTDTIEIPIGKGWSNTPSREMTWNDLITTQGMLPTDSIKQFIFKDRKESGAFSMKHEDELEYEYATVMIVLRDRPETDDEYFQRMKILEAKTKRDEEAEKLNYLRLKAKYENSANE